MRKFVFEFRRQIERVWIEHSFYADDEVEAWQTADEWAFYNGYTDYRLYEII